MRNRFLYECAAFFLLMSYCANIECGMALPISPNSDPLQSHFLLTTEGYTRYPPSWPIEGIFGTYTLRDGVFDSDGNPIQGGVSTARTDVVRGRPAAFARAHSNNGTIDKSTSAYSTMAYVFTIEPRSTEALDLDQVPVSITVALEAYGSTNGYALAEVLFGRGDFRFSRVSPGFRLSGFDKEVLAFYSEEVPLLSNETHTLPPTAFPADIEFYKEYAFILTARARANSLGGGEVVAYAFADPLIEFDQQRFDEMMGDQSFSLAENFIIKYSPGLEDYQLPEPSSVILAHLCFVGLLIQRVR